MPPNVGIQDVIDPWWIKDERRELGRGRLIWTYVPHVDQVPQTLVPEARSEATDHQHARFRLTPLRAKDAKSSPKLPVAALPQFPKEVYAVYRAKRRPKSTTAACATRPRATSRQRRESNIAAGQTYMVWSESAYNPPRIPHGCVGDECRECREYPGPSAEVEGDFYHKKALACFARAGWRPGRTSADWARSAP